MMKYMTIIPYIPFYIVETYFTLPQIQAADMLGMSVTTLKKFCRENGVHRWPHRSLTAQPKRKSKKQQYHPPSNVPQPITSPVDDLTIPTHGEEFVEISDYLVYFTNSV